MKLLRYLWALPNTLLGLLFVPLAIFTQGGMRVVLLMRCVGLNEQNNNQKCIQE
jgi:hypothetical protein